MTSIDPTTDDMSHAFRWWGSLTRDEARQMLAWCADEDSVEEPESALAKQIGAGLLARGDDPQDGLDEQGRRLVAFFADSGWAEQAVGWTELEEGRRAALMAAADDPAPSEQVVDYLREAGMYGVDERETGQSKWHPAAQAFLQWARAAKRS
ncbi:hypothetical protein Kisp01_67010 [Kineosporia sp. NBRC 101677]|uniref:hypothetical protein n=1 Tax=Kineosporia sp. NBRC 101677 TaxID=3032197 RepID=UPI0024A0CCD2|nr:hypothetical protein [Kineosporia sp. NBRC 101677]GLY19687.1 hypothetical protein Kisp01_67010 [Kineosporia sp. NBRC 101677]